MIGSALAVLVALPASLLPSQWRARYRHLPLVAGTALSGVAEFLAGMLLFELGAFHSVAGSWPLLERFTFGPSRNVAASGVLGYLSFLFTVPGMLAISLVLEGALRAVSAVGAGEPVGGAAPWLCFQSRQAWRRWRDRSAPSRPADRITATEQGFRVESASPKAWDELTTVEVEGKLYRVELTEEVAGPWPSVTILTPIAASWIIRRLVKLG